MHLVRAADGFRLGFAQAQRPHLARLHQFAHRAHRILDRHRGIDAMLVVEIDHVDAEPLEAGLAGGLHIGRAAVDSVGAARLLRLAELGGEHDLGAPAAGQRLAEQRLVVAPAIHVGTVEEGDAAIERVMDDADRLGVVALAVGAGERHAAEPDREDGERAVAQGAGLCVRVGGHGNPLCFTYRKIIRASQVRIAPFCVGEPFPPI